jgi:hypothetical protein
MMLILAKSICLSSFLQRLRRCNNQGEPSTMDVTMDIGIGCPAGAGRRRRGYFPYNKIRKTKLCPFETAS